MPSTITLSANVLYRSVTSQPEVFRTNKLENLAISPGSAGSTRPSWNSSSTRNITPRHPLPPLPYPRLHPRPYPTMASELYPTQLAQTHHPTRALTQARHHGPQPERKDMT